MQQQLTHRTGRISVILDLDDKLYENYSEAAMHSLIRKLEDKATEWTDNAARLHYERGTDTPVDATIIDAATQGYGLPLKTNSLILKSEKRKNRIVMGIIATAVGGTAFVSGVSLNAGKEASLYVGAAAILASTINLTLFILLSLSGKNIQPR